MAADVVIVGVRDRVATVTLNRPDRLNALDGASVNALLDRLLDVADDRSVRVVVLTGAGRAFCAGGDVANLAAPGPRAGPGPDPALGGDPASGGERRRETRQLMQIPELLHSMAKPTIAAINGACAGAGLSFAAAADLRYAAASAVFATAFLRVGVSGDHGGIWSVTKAVGPARARELFLLGDRFGADDALRFGLVHAVLPDDELLAHAQSVAARLAASSPSAVRAIKENLNDALDLPLGSYLDRETERFLAISGSPDAREAARAFLEKRAPVFDDQ